MHSWFRLPTKIELIVQCLLAFLFFIIVHDWISATGAQACGSEGAGRNCYPWGTEGPLAGDWAYETKERYLYTGVAFMEILLVCFLIPFFTDGLKKSLTFIGVVLLISSIGGMVAQRAVG